MIVLPIINNCRMLLISSLALTSFKHNNYCFSFEIYQQYLVYFVMITIITEKK